jgi:hypothetical protein
VNTPASERTSIVLESSLAPTQPQDQDTKGIDEVTSGSNVSPNGSEASSHPHGVREDPVQTQAFVGSRPQKAERELYSLEHHNPLRDSIYSLQSEGMFN